MSKAARDTTLGRIDLVTAGRTHIKRRLDDLAPSLAVERRGAPGPGPHEKEPRTRTGAPDLSWRKLRAVAGVDGTIWGAGNGVRVVSSLVLAESPVDGTPTMTWHVSITKRGKRPKPTDIRGALRAFDMRGAENDNHHPGNAMHYFMPVDPAHRADCECKTTENTIVEPDGYKWTNPKEGQGDCRGCETSQLFGRPCPIHATANQHGETK